MTVQQAVQAYLEHMKMSGYSNSEQERKTRILDRWFTPALALYHPAIPSRIAAFSVSELPPTEATEDSRRFLQVFHKGSVSVMYMNLAVFFEAHPEFSTSATSILQFLAGRLAVTARIKSKA